MSALGRFFGRDTKFYDLLEGSAAAAHESTAMLVQYFTQMSATRDETSLSELAQVRRRHKRLSQQTTEELCRTFVTPLEREDIEALSIALHKITKSAEKIGEHLIIGPQGLDSVAMERQLKLLEQGAQIVKRMVGQLRVNSHGEKIRSDNEQLQSIEGDADKLMNSLLRDLYHGDADARLVVFWKDLYELMEKAIDRCRDAGQIVFQVALKYS